MFFYFCRPSEALPLGGGVGDVVGVGRRFAWIRPFAELDISTEAREKLKEMNNGIRQKARNLRRRHGLAHPTGAKNEYKVCKFTKSILRATT